LGKGAYGTVFQAKLKDTGHIRAIKQIKKMSIRNPAAFIN
jgi:serine/threonine protein kinase